MGLLEHLDEICYFAKDADGRFAAANTSLVLLLGQASAENVLGKTDYELVPSYLADAYRKDDLKILRHGASILNKVELVTRNDLSVQWYTTTKAPLFGYDGRIVGLEGATRPFHLASGALGPYPELFRVVDYVERNYAERITVGELAERAGQSVRTFERQFRKRFNLSPISYLKKVRINAACRELIQGHLNLAQIAVACGFCDQSYMTKEFARLMQVTPQVYREAYSARNQQK